MILRPEHGSVHTHCTLCDGKATAAEMAAAAPATPPPQTTTSALNFFTVTAMMMPPDHEFRSAAPVGF